VPVLHVLAGPNGAGKTTLYETRLGPITHLPFINADEIARAMFPGSEERKAYEAARMAETRRQEWIAQRQSFATETVFSHPSKLELIRTAKAAGYLVHLHVVLAPLDLVLARVPLRVEHGGHSVPEEKIRQRYRRIWPLVREAIALADDATVYDNSRARLSHREVARYRSGRPVFENYPAWSPLKIAGRD
jgi:predicted ABC-type ATPase